MKAPRIDIPNARMPADNILTGGQPTPEQLQAAQQGGYRTIVNLRLSQELDWNEAERVRTLGMNYVNIPISGPDDLTTENAHALAKVLDDLSLYPLMVHCGSGNRVGALFAIKAALLDGEDASTAMEIGRQTGLAGMADAVRQRLQS